MVQCVYITIKIRVVNTIYKLFSIFYFFWVVYNGFLIALVPLLISFISITEYSGVISSCITSESFNILVESTSQPNIGHIQTDVWIMICVMLVVLLILIIPMLYLELKYREYKAKFIQLHIVEVAEKFIEKKHWHVLSIDADKQLIIYNYINKVTCFSEDDILYSLYGWYGDKILPLLDSKGYGLVTKSSNL